MPLHANFRSLNCMEKRWPDTRIRFETALNARYEWTKMISFYESIQQTVELTKNQYANKDNKKEPQQDVVSIILITQR